MGEVVLSIGLEHVLELQSVAAGVIKSSAGRRLRASVDGDSLAGCAG